MRRLSALFHVDCKINRATMRAYLPWKSPSWKSIEILAAMVAISGLIAGLAPVQARAETLVIQGSTTFNTRLLEPYQKLLEEMAKVDLQVFPNKSLNGLLAILEGRADLAMISAPLQAELPVLRAMANGRAVERLQAHEIARTRVAFAVNPSNPVRATTLETIRRVLRGEIANWRDLGGADLPLRVAFVAKAGGVTQTVQDQLLKGESVRPTHPIPLATPMQVVKVVEQESDVLGIAQIRLAADRKLAELSTDATVEQLLYIVTLDQPSPAAKRVIDAARLIAEKRLAEAQH